MSPPSNLFMFSEEDGISINEAKKWYSEEDGISINEAKKILIQKKC